MLWGLGGVLGLARERPRVRAYLDSLPPERCHREPAGIKRRLCTPHRRSYPQPPLFTTERRPREHERSGGCGIWRGVELDPCILSAACGSFGSRRRGTVQGPFMRYLSTVIQHEVKPSEAHAGEAHAMGEEISMREVRKRGSSERLSKERAQMPQLGGRGLSEPLVHRLELLSSCSAHLEEHFH